MQEVRSGECFCPRTANISFRSVVNPPTASYLVDGIYDTLTENGNYNNADEERAYKRLAVFIKRHPPEKQWLMGLLCLLMPEHEVFQKGYIPPHKIRAEIEA